MSPNHRNVPQGGCCGHHHCCWPYRGRPGVFPAMSARDQSSVKTRTSLARLCRGTGSGFVFILCFSDPQLPLPLERKRCQGRECVWFCAAAEATRRTKEYVSVTLTLRRNALLTYNNAKRFREETRNIPVNRAACTTSSAFTQQLLPTATLVQAQEGLQAPSRRRSHPAPQPGAVFSPQVRLQGCVEGASAPGTRPAHRRANVQPPTA